MTQSFKLGLKAAKPLAIIGEIKRRSPSKGPLNLKLDPAQLAKIYAEEGLAAISVLTNKDFGGSLKDLEAVRQAVNLPILRKDFIETKAEINQTAASGAQAVLLIAPNLSVKQLKDCCGWAKQVNLEPVVEIQSVDDIAKATLVGAEIILVNQRNNPQSSQARVNFTKASQLASSLPANSLKIAASGIEVAGGTPLSEVIASGYQAVLVGEALVTAPDIRTKLRQLNSYSN